MLYRINYTELDRNHLIQNITNYNKNVETILSSWLESIGLLDTVL